MSIGLDEPTTINRRMTQCRCKNATQPGTCLRLFERCKGCKGVNADQMARHYDFPPRLQFFILYQETTARLPVLYPAQRSAYVRTAILFRLFVAQLSSCRSA